jgi:catechol 2,3-dioxygenase-like lactoylglutathione lyase family enzyme
MSTDITGIDHVGITVADLEAVSAFFVDLGFEVEGRTFLEGDFLDTVVGLTGARTEMVMLRPPDGGTRLELTRFVRPAHESRPPVLATELGLSNVSFEVRDLQAVLDRLEAAGYGLIGGVGQHEQVWRMASVRGPEGMIVNFAERMG